MRRSLLAALEHGDGGIEHHGRIDLALLHRGDRGGTEADADHGGPAGIEPILLQLVLQEEIRGGAGCADADLLACEILDRFDFTGVNAGETTSTSPG